MREKSKILMVLLVVFVGIFILSNFTIYTSDDISYLYVYESYLPTGQTRRVESLADLNESISNHYKEVNGRSLPHFLLQASLAMGDGFFNFLNSIFYILAGLVLLAIVKKDIKEARALDYVLIYSFLFLFIPQFGAAVLWKSGAANYLWMLVFILAYSLCWVSWDRAKRVNPILAVGLGLLAGASSENGSGMVIMLGGLFIFKWLLKKRKIRPSQILAFLASCLGLIYQLMAPGNRVRLMGNSSLSLNERISLAIEKTMETSGLLLAVLIILMIISLIKSKRISENAVLFILPALAGAGVMALTPNLADRSWLWTVAFLFIAIAFQWEELKEGKIKKDLALKLLTLGLFIFSSYNYSQAYLSIHKSYEENQRTLEEVGYQKSQGKKDIIVEKFNLPTNKYNALSETYNLREDPSYWFNQWFAFHYGLNSVSISNPDQAR